MTAATFGRSLGASVSFSTIDAIIRTSYGVRFLLFAYARFTWFQFLQNVSSWSAARSRDFVVARKSYVAGKRNPSRFARDGGVKQGTLARRVASAYVRELSATAWCFLRAAIFATAPTRSIICA